MLLRWFIALYDLSIIDEEAFMRWKEDVNDAYPGKGDALFQVIINKSILLPLIPNTLIKLLRNTFYLYFRT